MTCTERIVDADVHSLTVHLAGTFTPTAEMDDDARRADALLTDVVERARPGLRPGADGLLDPASGAGLPGPAPAPGELAWRWHA